MLDYVAAPWPKSLRVISVVGTVLICGVGYLAWRAIPHGTRAPFAVEVGTVVACVPPAILLFAALFVVRGYGIEPGALAVRRLLWSTRVELDGPARAWSDPAAMCRSLRLFGNGGLYGITGLFRNPGLGRYRAFVTDPARAVVVRTAARTVVVSPADPERFLAGLRAVVPHVEIGAAPAAGGRR